MVKGKRVAAYPAVGPEVTAAGGKAITVKWEEAITDGNLVTGPAWTAHVEWIRQFLEVLGTKIVHQQKEEAMMA